MNKTIGLLLFLLFSSYIPFAQDFDAPFSQKKMRKDLELFKELRLEANSGLYKYRTKQEIDSIYAWADQQIEQSSTYRDFYNIICHLTDFEGSLHNSTYLPKRVGKSLWKEQNGYFPYPVKWVEDKWILNYDSCSIPLGSQILSINDENIENIVPKLYKYYTTDGINTSGKQIGLNCHFSKYYRMHYGKTDRFTVTFQAHNSTKTEAVELMSVGYKDYYKNVRNRYSKPFDKLDYTSYNKLDEKFSYEKLDSQTAIFTINTFVIGWHAQDPEHIAYTHYLDSIFSDMQLNKIQNLIVDVRHNGGGSDPNDLVTYSYLTDRNFSENKQAWISFEKVPQLRHNVDSRLPYLIKLIGVRKYNKEFQEEFPQKKNGGFYQDSTSSDHLVREPKANAFKGKVYLLISPRVASAGSLFAAMVAGNSNTIVVGEETMGGYYGHNGHIPLSYDLPKSKLGTDFSVVNLEQDVPKKENQIYERGIIPDYEVHQSFEDYLKHEDTQMKFVLDLIEKGKKN
jgi:hypothetical protein